VPARGPRRIGRLVGLYALNVMAREGPTHGYELSKRIAERTHGSWRPGPGAVYPALTTLTQRGLARSKVVGRRRVYAITPSGRRALRGVRARFSGRGGSAPDLSILWAEIAGDGDTSGHLLRHIRRHLDQALEHLAGPDVDPRSTELREGLGRELAAASARLRDLPRPRSPATGRSTRPRSRS
jgi:DNA-binding PadR family transcriptional regulator